jgi:hypothetical protein
VAWQGGRQGRRGDTGGRERGWRSLRGGRTHRGRGHRVEELVGQGRHKEDEGDRAGRTLGWGSNIKGNVS